MKDSKPQASCRNCEIRYSGCHSKCEDYKAFRAELDEWNKADKRRREEHSIYVAHVRRNYNKHR